MRAQWVRLCGAALILGVVLACNSDRSTGPQQPAVSMKKMKLPKKLGQLIPDTVDVAVRLSPLANDVTVSKVIGTAGGTISIPEAGVKLIVPAGAVSSNVNFTMTALRGPLIAYEFGPHGTVFNVPVQVEQATSGLFVLGDDALTAGYFTDRADLENEDTVGDLAEENPVTKDTGRSVLRFNVNHFSGYLVASGRTKTY
jgi:hypothetical protein